MGGPGPWNLTYGLPQDEDDADYATYAVKPFEQYIEVQVWSDDPVAAHLPHGP